MKKIIIIFLSISLFFISCKKEEELSYLETQIKKQKENIATECKKKIDFKQFKKSLESINEKKYNTIKNLVNGKSIPALQKQYLKGKLTIRETVLYFLKRLKKYKELNVLISLNPDALKIAGNQDKHIDKIKNKPLFGIPVLVKDNIAVKGMPNTAGAKALLNLKPKNDAHLIKKIKKAGAIIIGKANLSEWANFMSSNSVNGYSALGGQTHNPYGNFDVGGSSSGAAVAVAANLVPVALGTETCGSLIYPASQNSVVTLKSTTGLISRVGIIPLSYTQDTAGPIAKNIQDAAILFEVMVGYDSDDPKTEIAKNYKTKSPSKYLNKNYLKNKKIGLVINEKIESWYRGTDKQIINRVIKDLKKIGAEVVRIKLDEKIFNTDMRSVYYHEFDKNLNKYLKEENYNKFQTLKEIIEYNKKDKKNRAYYGQDLLIKTVKKDFTKKENKKNIKINRKNTKGSLDTAFELKNLDFIMTLSNYLSGVYAPAGYPAINIPAGYRPNGEPIGITFIAKALEDRKLLKAGYSFQQHTQYRKAP